MNKRQAHWILYLSRFGFTLKHVLETKMGKTNELSRQLDWKVRTENNNNNWILIKNQWICSWAEVVIKGLEVEIIEKIKIAKNKDEEVVRVVEGMKKARVKVLREEKWQMKKKIVLNRKNRYWSIFICIRGSKY